jgi:hypothetical protein
MPALLTIKAKRLGSIADVAHAPYGRVERDEIVSVDARLWYVLGFDADDGPRRRAYLEDVETHDVRTAALTELAEAPQAAAA